MDTVLDALIHPLIHSIFNEFVALYHPIFISLSKLIEIGVLKYNVLARKLETKSLNISICFISLPIFSLDAEVKVPKVFRNIILNAHTHNHSYIPTFSQIPYQADSTQI